MKSLAIAGCAVVLGVGILMLSCCAPEPAAPSPGPTVTVTPVPAERVASDPLTTLDAWLACSFAVQGNYALQNEGTVMSTYDTSMVSPGESGGFIVKVGFEPPGGSTTNQVVGAQGICTVSGTVGEPVIKEIAFSDFA